MESFTFLVFPAITLGGVALGLVIYSIKQIRILQEKVKVLESKKN
ncbi:hypothetical protein [Solibacillus palustris]|nr:hypothetical protein [Solibacillus sp. MA9]